MKYKYLDPFIWDFLFDKPFIRFLFEEKKVFYEMREITSPRKLNIKLFIKFIKHIKRSFNIKLKCYMGWEKNEDGYALGLFKEDLNYNLRNYHLKLGQYFNIPKCCVKKYLKEQKWCKITSYNSAKRYLGQCKRMKIKDDIFRIKIIHDGADCTRYGFVPCSPRCKEALRIVKSTDSLQNKVIKSFS